MYIHEKIRVLRRRAALTLDQLASRCHITKGYLSKLERNQQPPSISTLQTIAQALGVEIAEFFNGESSEVGQNSDVDIVRKQRPGHRAKQRTGTSYGYDYTPLVRSLRGKQMSPMLMVVAKGRTDAFTHDSEEFIYVVKGSVDLQYEGQVHVLGEGDSVYFDSRQTHRFANHQEEPAILVAVAYNYRRF